jgi:16S rRNA (uracil1498-N3)-methyltransferase
MRRELRRLLIAPERIAAVAAADGAPADGAEGLLALEPREAHYLERVLRYRPGDRLEVVDGRGRLWTATLEAGRGLRLEHAGGSRSGQEPPWPPLGLAMAVPKREADLVWRMATELGADRLQPLLASRGAPGERCALQRWEGIVREATEQCERLWHPALLTPEPAEAWLGRPVEGLALLATTRRDGLPLCGRVLAELGGTDREAALRGGVHLAIGPEGGWSPQEEGRAEAGGWRPVSLGESILRTSTAAVAGLAALAAWRALSCASCRRPSP